MLEPNRRDFVKALVAGTAGLAFAVPAFHAAVGCSVTLK
jgi:hypothetical protein